MKRLLAIWKSWPRRRRRLTAWIAGCLLFYTVFGFLLLPWIVRSVATRRLARELDRPVAIRSVRINPYSFACSVRGLLIQDKDGEPFASWDEVYVNFQLASFFGKPWVFKRVSATNIYVRAQMNRDYTFNFSDLIAKFAALPHSDKPSKPLALRIDQLEIGGARASFTDMTPRNPFRRVVGPLEITLNNFHTDPDSRNPYSFVGSTDAGESFAWSGQFSLAPVRSSGEVTFSGFSIAKYAPLFEDLIRFEVKDGVIDGQSTYQFTMTPSNVVAAVTNTGFRLASLKLAEKGSADNLVELEEFSVHGVAADTASRRLEIGEVNVSGGRFEVKRARDETVNLVELSGPPPEVTNAPGGLLVLMRAATNAFDALLRSTNLWSGTVHQFDLTNCSLRWEDLVNSRPVKVSVDDLALTARHLSNVPGSNATAVLSLKWNTNGAVRVDTSISISPPEAQVMLSFKDLELRPLDPYLEPYLNLYIINSKVGMDGRLKMALGSNGLPDVNFQGEARMDDFATVDSRMTEDLVKWKSVQVSGLEANLQPPSVAIERILVIEPFARVAVETNRELNLMAALKMGTTNDLASAQPPVQPPPATPKKKGGGPGQRLGTMLRQSLSSATNAGGGVKITVASIVVSNAFVQFTDRSLQPPVNVSLQELDGTILGISSDELKRAEIHLVGKANRTGPIEINGKINPLSQNSPTELQVVFHDVDLSPTSPYAGKFLGYRLNRGKLDLQVNYEISQRQVKAKNLLVLNQFTLGEKVDSPDATSLPVRLAIALLKDRNGKIEINVPIEGNLDDPQFHYGKVVSRVFVNLITKMVTSPFAALGALFGGKGEEVSYQDFAPGSVEPQAAGAEKLQALIHGLEERPGLQLEIEGSSEPAADREALRRQKLMKDLRRKKWAALRESEQAKITPDQVPLAPDEYDSYVRAAFNAVAPSLPRESPPSTSIKPSSPRAAATSKKAVDKGATALVKQPSLESTTGLSQMERAVLDRFEVSDEELNRLAQERARQIQQRIVESGKVDAARITLADVAGSTNHATRVFFHLQ